MGSRPIEGSHRDRLKVCGIVPHYWRHVTAAQLKSLLGRVPEDEWRNTARAHHADGPARTQSLRYSSETC